MKKRLLLRSLVISIVGIATNLYASDDLQHEIETSKFLSNCHIQDQAIVEQVETHSQPSQPNTLNDDDYLSQLAYEIKLQICQFLSVGDIKQLGRVNTIWRPIPYTALEIKYLQFAYTHQPHFDGYLSHVHRKFIIAVLEQRFLLKLTKEIGHATKLVITDNGQFTKIASPTFIFPKIEGIELHCVSADVNTFGGVCKRSNYQDKKYRFNIAAIYRKDSNSIIRIGESNTVILSDQDIIEYSTSVTALNYNGSIALCDNYFRGSFIWREGQGIKRLFNFTGNDYNRAWCTSDNSEIIGGWAIIKDFRCMRASIWVDIDYHYDLDRLLRKFGSPDLQAILQKFSLTTIYQLSKNGTAMLCNITIRRAPDETYYPTLSNTFSILTFW